MAQAEDQILPGKMRQPKAPGAIAQRIARELARLRKELPVGVHPLNPGFVKLEDIRRNATAKKKTAKRKALKGK